MTALRKPSKYRNKPEEALQRQCVAWLRSALPPPPEGPVWTFVNNGMKRTKAEAGIAKAMGQRAGWPDLLMIWRGKAFCPEFKAPGRPAKADKGSQEECQAEIWEAGGEAHNFNSFDDFVGFMHLLAEEFGCRIRAR